MRKKKKKKPDIYSGTLNSDNDQFLRRREVQSIAIKKILDRIKPSIEPETISGSDTGITDPVIENNQN